MRFPEIPFAIEMELEVNLCQAGTVCWSICLDFMRFFFSNENVNPLLELQSSLLLLIVTIVWLN